MKIIIATKNEGKAKEFAQLLEPYDMDVSSLLDYSDAVDVEETGTTFAENAVLKAEAIAEQYQAIVIADDSGLVIDALDGRPGVYSARYAGLDKNDEANIDKVLTELESVPDKERTAHFQCVLAAVVPGEKPDLFSGQVHGLIAQERQGDGGFGYDPIFYLPEQEKAMAQLSHSEKNAMSHRGRALDELMKNWRVIHG